MIRKILNILLIVPVLYLVLIPFFLASSLNSRPCSGIVIDIADSSDYHFVTKRQLVNLVYGNSSQIIGKKIKDIPVFSIEKRIKNLHELKTAEVYTSVDGSIHVYADQRTPIMRVMPDDGGDYFVDDHGYVFRRRNLYNPRLHIVEGNVTITGAMLDSLSVLDTCIKHSILKEMFGFVKYINSDSFWSAQIDQIYVDGNSEIDLIPRVGNHTVHLGTFENYKGKLRNLAAFYEQVLPEVGWNKYSNISLEYKDQIVCKKR
jgi:cell division protein FtsQ